jgi:hypothetical protein
VTSVGMRELIAPPLPLALADRLGRWFEQRLADCPPAPSSALRLYGLEVIDADGLDAGSPTAVRVVYLGDCAHDAVAIVRCSGASSGASVDGDEIHHHEHVRVRGQVQCRVALAVEHL